MLYPKNNRNRSTYHDPLFFEPSKDLADSRTQTYFHWYKGDRNGTQDKNFYPSRWPRITNNERNYSHEVFKFGNCSPLRSNSNNHIPPIKVDQDRFTGPNPELYLKQQQKIKKDTEMRYLNNIKMSREKREKNRWNKIVMEDNASSKRLEEKRLHSKYNRPGKGFNIINNQYANDARGRELALIDSIQKEKINYLAMKRYEQVNTYDPVKGIDIVKRYSKVNSQLKNENQNNQQQDQNYILQNEKSAANIAPIYQLNATNQMSTDKQLEKMLVLSHAELNRRKNRISEFQNKKK
ncbi:hypothetical protein H8356DRAFT_1733661 [Neocallimastix lanati (nom. inval.)]|jgi:hypothetical protein|uniref:Uncharacterized protein n=1 Tax=Neocallimastix californiae TaxID=1754190 RepID=A0A1Y1ZWT7_9FUNG|nr:hypothetical protein H8356DRAFT_1733661 [Neocallimastix sp. JGI-2020a]ORY14713.1 hypothetical protein LY90DRAFT_677604 [Neocallimastix californiae]|eukprot:ORY14713.1 hypothetical protein LY90DRAFT_677604 [Neocallimastix californiae]